MNPTPMALLATILLAAILMAGSTLPAAAEEAERPAGVTELVAELDSPRFPARARARDELARRAAADPAAVIPRLFDDDAPSGPEFRRQREDFMWALFARLQLGAGVPATGVSWGRMLFIDADGLPAALPMVVEIEPGSPATRAGLRVGDCVSAVNGTALPDGDALPGFRAILAEAKPGEVLQLGLRRHQLDKGERRIVRPEEAKSARVELELGAPVETVRRVEKEDEFEFWKENLLRDCGIAP